jgi:hypothetical protein
LSAAVVAATQVRRAQVLQVVVAVVADLLQVQASLAKRHTQ